KSLEQRESWENKLEALEYGIVLGVMPHISINEIKKVLDDIGHKNKAYEVLLSSGRADYFTSSESSFDKCLEWILDARPNIFSYFGNQATTSMEAFAIVHSPYIYLLQTHED